MKKLIAILTIFACASFGAAAAGPNTITFQGEVSEQTCEVTINGNAANPTVLLPTVSTSDLSTAGSTAGETTFTLALSGCSGTATTTQTNFVGNNVDANGNLANIVGDGYATNVALQLLDAPGGAAIDLNSTTSVAGIDLADTETSGSVDYAVQYISADGGATAGFVTGSVQYSITYQ